MGLEIISNSRILKFKILGEFVKSKSLTLFKLSKQGIWISITQIQILPSKHTTKKFTLFMAL